MSRSYCWNCGQRVSDAKGICPHCAADLSVEQEEMIQCSMGHTIPKSSKFCPWCSEDMQASEKDNGPGIVSSPNIDAGGDKLKNLEDNDSKQNILSSKDAEAKFKDPRETPKEKSIPPSRPHGVKSPTDPWMSPPEYAGRRASRQALSRNGSEYNGTLIFRDGRAEEDNLHKLVGFLVSYTIFSDGAYFPLREGRQSIGRRKNMNICILTDRLLSEEHAVIIYRDGRFIFKDNGSTNGSFVNGKEVLEQTRLENGDTIKMGTHTYTLVVIPRIKPELPKD